MLKARILAIFAAVVGVAGAYACKTAHDSNVKEAWDTLNDPSKFGAAQVSLDQITHSDWTSGKLDQVPWADTYWPLKRIGFADRWIDETQLPKFSIKTTAAGKNYSSANDRKKFYDDINKEIALALDQAKNIAKNASWNQTLYVSPAEKYDIGVGDSNFSLTKKELNAFADNRWSYEPLNISWGWMGFCHGWASASYMYSAPEYGVLVKNSTTGQEVMFTPGDVRGLLTKTAADNSFDASEQFMGSRCNDDDNNIPRDELNRMIDGALGSGWDAAKKKFNSYRRIRVIANNWTNSFELGDTGFSLVFRFEPDAANPNPGDKLYHLSVNQWVNNDGVADVAVHEVKVFKDGKVELGDAYTASGNLFRYYKACRDVNPGSFHTVIARSLSKGGSEEANRRPRGFVLDITRDDEVWNHPVYSFRSKIGKPTPLKVQGSSGEVVDPYQKWRAEKTASIVDVYTEVVYGVENGPFVTFRASDETVRKLMYHYTLELDQQGVIIGGEWHGRKSGDFDSSQPKSGEELLRELTEMISSQTFSSRENAPDFMWGYEPNAPFKATNFSVIKPDFVKKVYDCSVDASAAKKSYRIKNTDFEYVECTY